MKRLIKSIDRSRADRVVKIIRPYLSGLTLDVGCWNGEVASRLELDELIGIDIVTPPDPQIPVTLYDGIHIPYANQKFETVLCCTALHHANAPDKLLNEMKRVGKRLVILEDAYDTFCQRSSVLLLHAIGSRLTGIDFSVKGFRHHDDWCTFFRNHGLRIEKASSEKGIQPYWPFLRHHLFVLEADEGNNHDETCDNNRNRFQLR